MEKGQPSLDSRHSPQGQSKGEDQIHPQTSALPGLPSESSDYKETPEEAQSASDSADHLQAKSLWRPIPPLLPEPQRDPTSESRDQSCQTEETFPPTTAYNYSHNPGWLFYFVLSPRLAFFNSFTFRLKLVNPPVSLHCWSYSEIKLNGLFSQ